MKKKSTQSQPEIERPSLEIYKKLKKWAKKIADSDGMTGLIVSQNKKEVWELEDVIYWAAVEAIESRSKK